ncbi:glutamine--fructose-6-phosphate transaminase (isomerizing) [Halieaceae bacterium]|nr:glutamine--fructose-6-phosphate transaminase (isomerizing) [Halieaceae bacterium]
MCGIVGATARRQVPDILLEGLRRLEYRGYDSAGLVVIDNQSQLQLHKAMGKVVELENLQREDPQRGITGIAHTRWATHGEPSKDNAHPHISCDEVALVHNGIIENYEELRAEAQQQGYKFCSGTDTEVVVHLIHHALKSSGSLLQALQEVTIRLEGAFAIAAVSRGEPDVIAGARRGSPLVVGVGIGENFLASDPLALRQVTDRFIYLEDGDLVQISADKVEIINAGEVVERPVERLGKALEYADRGGYSHYMLKEIYEQPRALADTLVGKHSRGKVLDGAFGAGAEQILDQVANIQIVACGTSYHAGLIARYWLEEWAGIPCQVEVASEFRYRKRVTQVNTLLLTISQSGETADTLAALRNVAEQEFIASMAIVNVANSSLARESDLVFMTEAGTEIGVASTKALTTQLVALLLLVSTMARRNGDEMVESHLISQLQLAADAVKRVLPLDGDIERVARGFADKHHALFLGRGIHYPVALEGALKLKEISYIHAEAYPAGELKHGPLALVDDDMPVVAVAPSGDLLQKLKSNLEEVRARGGELYVFADVDAGFVDEPGVIVLSVPHCPPALTPLVYTVVLQLLAYHVAVLKGTDVDQPRNLAKSVTVE